MTQEPWGIIKNKGKVILVLLYVSTHLLTRHIFLYPVASGVCATLTVIFLGINSPTLGPVEGYENKLVFEVLEEVESDADKVADVDSEDVAGNYNTFQNHI